MKCRLGPVLSLALLLPASTAAATGVCENNPTTYELIQAALPAGLLAFSVEVHDCEEVQVGGAFEEKRSTTALIMVTDLTLKNETRYAAGPRDAATTLARGAKTSEKDWQTLRRTKNFRPIAEVALGSSGLPNCQVEQVAILGSSKAVPFAEAPTTKGSFSIHALGLRLRIGKRVLPPLLLGKHAVEADKAQVWTVPVPGGARSYTITATCAGPPPGYMDPDFPGTCYPTWSLGYKDHRGRFPEECLPVSAAPAAAPAPPRPATPAAKRG